MRATAFSADLTPRNPFPIDLQEEIRAGANMKNVENISGFLPVLR